MKYLDEASLAIAKADLEVFIREVFALLSNFAEDKKLYAKLFIDRFYESYHAAFMEFSRSEYMNRLFEKLKNAKSSQLYFAGLYGDQLKFKLQMVRDWLKKWSIEERTQNLILKLLATIDVALDSLLEALGMKSALKELKDGLMAQIQ